MICVHCFCLAYSHEDVNVDNKQSVSVKVCLFLCAAVDSTEGEFGGGEPSPAEPDPDSEPAEPDIAGKVHGEQRAVP